VRCCELVWGGLLCAEGLPCAFAGAVVKQRIENNDAIGSQRIGGEVLIDI
jgi:hypothetical protein